MAITIIEEGTRFGCRAGAIIFNDNKTKILLENQENGRYMFPGGRIDIHEDSHSAITRELEEELNLKLDLKLKYILEMVLKSPKTKYHEIGFYFLGTIKENDILNNTKSLDGNGIFEWVPVKDLKDYKILAIPIRNIIYSNKILNDDLEHIVYKEN